jgi:hypothetical protein
MPSFRGGGKWSLIMVVKMDTGGGKSVGMKIGNDEESRLSPTK